jgi:hypothetical protein
MLALLCEKWKALREVERDLFRLWVSYASSYYFNNNMFIKFLIHLIHMFSPPITHITPHLILSLGDEIDSRSDLASTAIARNQHETRGKGRKGLLSLIK